MWGLPFFRVYRLWFFHISGVVAISPDRQDLSWPRQYFTAHRCWNGITVFWKRQDCLLSMIIWVQVVPPKHSRSVTSKWQTACSSWYFDNSGKAAVVILLSWNNHVLKICISCICVDTLCTFHTFLTVSLARSWQHVTCRKSSANKSFQITVNKPPFYIRSVFVLFPISSIDGCSWVTTGPLQARSTSSWSLVGSMIPISFIPVYSHNEWIGFVFKCTILR